MAFKIYLTDLGLELGVKDDAIDRSRLKELLIAAQQTCSTYIDLRRENRGTAINSENSNVICINFMNCTFTNDAFSAETEMVELLTGADNLCYLKFSVNTKLDVETTKRLLKMCASVQSRFIEIDTTTLIQETNSSETAMVVAMLRYNKWIYYFNLHWQVTASKPTNEAFAKLLLAYNQLVNRAGVFILAHQLHFSEKYRLRLLDANVRLYDDNYHEIILSGKKIIDALKKLISALKANTNEENEALLKLAFDLLEELKNFFPDLHIYTISDNEKKLYSSMMYEYTETNLVIASNLANPPSAAHDQLHTTTAEACCKEYQTTAIDGLSITNPRLRLLNLLQKAQGFRYINEVNTKGLLTDAGNKAFLGNLYSQEEAKEFLKTMNELPLESLSNSQIYTLGASTVLYFGIFYKSCLIKYNKGANEIVTSALAQIARLVSLNPKKTMSKFVFCMLNLLQQKLNDNFNSAVNPEEAVRGASLVDANNKATQAIMLDIEPTESTNNKVIQSERNQQKWLIDEFAKITISRFTVIHLVASSGINNAKIVFGTKQIIDLFQEIATVFINSSNVRSAYLDLVPMLTPGLSQHYFDAYTHLACYTQHTSPAHENNLQLTINVIRAKLLQLLTHNNFLPTPEQLDNFSDLELNRLLSFCRSVKAMCESARPEELDDESNATEEQKLANLFAIMKADEDLESVVKREAEIRALIALKETAVIAIDVPVADKPTAPALPAKAVRVAKAVKAKAPALKQPRLPPKKPTITLPSVDAAPKCLANNDFSILKRIDLLIAQKKFQAAFVNAKEQIDAITAEENFLLNTKKYPFIASFYYRMYEAKKLQGDAKCNEWLERGALFVKTTFQDQLSTNVALLKPLAFMLDAVNELEKNTVAAATPVVAVTSIVADPVNDDDDASPVITGASSPLTSSKTDPIDLSRSNSTGVATPEFVAGDAIYGVLHPTLAKLSASLNNHFVVYFHGEYATRTLIETIHSDIQLAPLECPRAELLVLAQNWHSAFNMLTQLLPGFSLTDDLSYEFTGVYEGWEIKILLGDANYFLMDTFVAGKFIRANSIMLLPSGQFWDWSGSAIADVKNRFGCFLPTIMQIKHPSMIFDYLRLLIEYEFTEPGNEMNLISAYLPRLAQLPPEQILAAFAEHFRKGQVTSAFKLWMRSHVFRVMVPEISASFSNKECQDAYSEVCSAHDVIRSKEKLTSDELINLFVKFLQIAIGSQLMPDMDVAVAVHNVLHNSLGFLFKAFSDAVQEFIVSRVVTGIVLEKVRSRSNAASTQIGHSVLFAGSGGVAKGAVEVEVARAVC